MLGVLIAVVVVGLGIMARILADWFTALNADSEFQLGELSFEDPSSVKKLPAPSLFSEPSKSLSIVIPAYNEEDRLPATLTETMSYLQRRRDRQGASFTYEVVIVDDGSRDGTATTVLESARKHGSDAVRLLRLPRNRGKGYAVKAGVLCTRGQSVLFMDADGATKVSEIERLERKLKEVVDAEMSSKSSIGSKSVLLSSDATTTTASGDGTTTPSNGNNHPQQKVPAFGSVSLSSTSSAARTGGGGMFGSNIVGTTQSQQAKQQGAQMGLPQHATPAFVLGSRAHLQESAMAKRTWIRNFLMHGFHFLVTMVVGGTIRDTQCGFKLMTRAAAQNLVPNQRLQRWAFDVELVHIAHRLQVPMAEVQVTWTEIPGSKVRVWSIAHIAFELAMIKLGYSSGAWVVKGPAELVQSRRHKKAL